MLILRKAYNILKGIVVTALVLAVILPLVLFVALEVESVQAPVRNMAQTELSRLLGVKVDIGQVSIAPFNKITVRDICLTGDSAHNDTIAKIRKLGAGLNLYRYLYTGEIQFGYVELIGADITVRQPLPDAPLNISPIIEALKPKDENKEPAKYSLALQTVLLRRCRVSYSKDWLPLQSDRFDINHIQLDNLRADIRIPVLSNDEITVELNRLAFSERCGFVLDGLSGEGKLKDGSMTLSGLELVGGGSILSFSDMAIPVKGDGTFAERLKNHRFDISLLKGSKVSVGGLGVFVPVLRNYPVVADLDMHLEGTLSEMHMPHFGVESDVVSLDLENVTARDVDSDWRDVKIDNCDFDININSVSLVALLRDAGVNIPDGLNRCAGAIGSVRLPGSLTMSGSSVGVDCDLRSDIGIIQVNGTSDYNARRFAGVVETTSLKSGAVMTAFNLDKWLADNLTAKVEADLSLDGKIPAGTAEVTVSEVDFRGYNLRDIELTAVNTPGAGGAVSVVSDNVPLAFALNGTFDRSGEFPAMAAVMDVQRADLSLFADNLSGNSAGGTVELDISGIKLEDLSGVVSMRDIWIDGPSLSDTLIIKESVLHAERSPRSLSFDNELVSCELQGDYSYKTLMRDFKTMASEVFPSLIEAPDDNSIENSFDFNATIYPTAKLERFVKLPVSVIEPARVECRMDAMLQNSYASVVAPLLKQGKKFVENTRLTASVDMRDNAAAVVEVSTLYPLKKGKVALTLDGKGGADRADLLLNWNMPDSPGNSGKIAMDALFSRQPADNSLRSFVTLESGDITVNDTAWTISPGHMAITKNRIALDRIRIRGNRQKIEITGTASESYDESVHLALDNFNLDYLFETLNINHVTFGGRATGNFYASGVFSKLPNISTNDLYVHHFKYNKCVMGNADLNSGWDPSSGDITIGADIRGEGPRKIIADGLVNPKHKILDFKFMPTGVPLAFMNPFLSSFASDVTGEASGYVRLFGSFKDVDLEGDVYAHPVDMTVSYTGCTYSITDSVHFAPGLIKFDSITLRDYNGKTALLNGEVKHTYFKNAYYDINVSKAKNLLMYNQPRTTEQNWYGKIFGNGGVTVKGDPWSTSINVNASTSPGSSFDFVLSDTQNAQDAPFLTFRDATSRDTAAVDRRRDESSPSLDDASAEATSYNLDINVDVMPNTAVTLHMDDNSSGDCIRARGEGTMHLNYDSRTDVMGLFGSYRLQEGNYNFTLQDIIIKDFVIKPGSEIRFNGNPEAAILDINAYHALNANLSDLDESFSQDRELSRTSVPLHALLKLRGDLRAPEIGFDLEFPTLTSDTYRKVRSIISTEDMMNRQIIYLLALNRFYTPDYMAGATRGNELVSVASSTISSQLGNMLGALSDNLSIAPNFRSDRGDFSDMEFDVALSSRLLNNRLLLNGNLGYRDKSMNNSSFIGDFDIEYLLNRQGTLRLKAYNRYNDRNFYIKSALTTQGVGIVFRRDFDSLFKPKRMVIFAPSKK